MRALLGISCAILIASMVGAIADSVLESPYRSSCFEPYRAGDYETAAKTCLAAAESGDVESQLIVARIYIFSGGYFIDGGYGGEPSNYTEAMKWYRRAADQGNARGQFEVGQLYANGHGVVQDYLQAAKWYQLAAKQGYDEAQLYLGVLYEYGRGVEKDLVQAYKWYALAAETVGPKNPKAPSVKNRDYLARKLTAAQLEEAKKLVADWHPQ